VNWILFFLSMLQAKRDRRGLTPVPPTGQYGVPPAAWETPPKLGRLKGRKQHPTVPVRDKKAPGQLGRRAPWSDSTPVSTTPPGGGVASPPPPPGGGSTGDPPPAAPPRTYVTQKGDLGSTIAAKFTGDGNRWRELRDRNPWTSHPTYGMAFQPGSVLVLPDTWPAVPRGGQPGPGGGRWADPIDPTGPHIPGHDNYDPNAPPGGLADADIQMRQQVSGEVGLFPHGFNVGGEQE
jgi:hypothetical protein